MVNNKIYYIENTPWKDKLVLADVTKFNLRYSDTIIFYYDFSYSYLKIMSKQTTNNLIFISAINCCLRFYEVIKKLYPYNDVYVVIYTEDKLAKTLKIDSKTFRAVTDIIPNFAVVSKTNFSDLSYYNQKNYKHIFYGKCNNAKSIFTNSDTQQWLLFKGKIVIK